MPVSTCVLGENSQRLWRLSCRQHLGSVPERAGATAVVANLTSCHEVGQGMDGGLLAVRVYSGHTAVQPSGHHE
jgi:hypothetical protein